MDRIARLRSKFAIQMMNRGGNMFLVLAVWILYWVLLFGKKYRSQREAYHNALQCVALNDPPEVP